MTSRRVVRFVAGLLGMLAAAVVIAAALLRRLAGGSASVRVARNVTAVRPGGSRLAVMWRLGVPRVAGPVEWVYYFHPNSGYRIIFNQAGRVAEIRGWVS